MVEQYRYQKIVFSSDAATKGDSYRLLLDDQVHDSHNDDGLKQNTKKINFTFQARVDFPTIQHRLQHRWQLIVPKYR